MTLHQDIKQILKASRGYMLLLLFGLLPAIYGLSGFSSIGAEQRGVLIRFGQVVTDDMSPGMHYHLPWPMERLEKISVTELRSMELDFSANTDKSLQPEFTTGDGNLVDLALTVQYKVSGPAQFISSALDAEAILRQIVTAETLLYVGANNIDTLLTTGRSRFQSVIKTAIQQRLTDMDLGLRVTAIQILRLEPPASIKRAFDAVDTARSEKQKLIQEAEGERNTRLARARSEANRLRTGARASADELNQQAEGDTTLLLASLEQYEKTPGLTASTIYFSTIERIFNKVNLQIISP